ncbi:MAG: iron-siderophore ABC transporter substrate-binding protein [Oculatellaceae cyanobacterium Prado106]|nr:iron-siderophore ABC transporter substrate-binding protein [Oculatellaceae cyanobacterium Prado106]
MTDVHGQEGLFGASWSDVSDAEYLGSSSQPSLEKILKLKPDLILDRSSTYQYKLLPAIAPTVLVPDAYEAPADQVFFKQNLRYIAKLLSQEDKAEAVLRQYQQRVSELKKRLGNQLDQLKVAVIFYAEGYMYTISNQMNSLVPAVFNDVGLRYKFLSRNGDIKPMISIELLHEYDADILFIVNLVRQPPDFYLQQPLFSRLKAVKSNRAYVVSNEAWNGIGILGANNILDDLFKYLPEN